MPKYFFHFRYKPEKLKEMLALRVAGWSYQALADKYGCQKLTIRYLCRKNGLGSDTVMVLIRRRDAPTYISRATTDHSYREVTIGSTYPDERVSVGKTYAEYLAEAEARKKK